MMSIESLPDVVLMQIFTSCSWQDRIKLESVSRKFAILLRVSESAHRFTQEPADSPKLRVCAQDDSEPSSSTHLEHNKSTSVGDSTKITCYLKHNDQHTLPRLMTQVPFTQIQLQPKWTAGDVSLYHLLEQIAFHATQWLTQLVFVGQDLSLPDLASSDVQQYWAVFWYRLQAIDKLEFYSCKFSRSSDDHNDQTNILETLVSTFCVNRTTPVRHLAIANCTPIDVLNDKVVNTIVDSMDLTQMENLTVKECFEFYFT